MGVTLSRLMLVVLTVVVFAGCTDYGDISREQAVFKEKIGGMYNYVYGTWVDYNFHGNSVDIQAADFEANDFSCSYRLNENKTAWLKVGGDANCFSGDISVP
jgi:hypothetical protein